MKRAILGLLLAAGCGKVAEPLPPFVRIPEAATDLTVTQSGRSLFLTWTNPARNIDGSAASDLSIVRIRNGSSVAAGIPVTRPGQAQSHAIPVEALSPGPHTFSIEFETSRGKISGVSNSVSVTPVEVPGPVLRLRAVVDQRRITLEWDQPQEHPELVDGYLVGRVSPPEESQTVSERRYEDNRYEPGKPVSYQVTPVRSTAAGAVPGAASEVLVVQVEDRVPPKTPSRLDLTQSDMGGFLTWAANEETDLAGYRVFRSDRPDSGFMTVERLVTMNAFFDPSSRSGVYYAVSAVDEFGNESERSAPLRTP